MSWDKRGHLYPYRWPSALPIPHNPATTGPEVYRSCLMPRVRVATVNCTLRSFALAIVGAEYVLRRLEPGTHRWEQFVTPLELAGFARAAGLRRQSLRGVVYDPFRRDWPAVSVRKHHRLLRRLPATSTTTPPPPHLP
jgi:hypothetical protein